MNHLEGSTNLNHTNKILTTPRLKASEKNVGKGENAADQHFLLFRIFYPITNTYLIIQVSHLIRHLQMIL